MGTERAEILCGRQISLGWCVVDDDGRKNEQDMFCLSPSSAFVCVARDRTHDCNVFPFDLYRHWWRAGWKLWQI